MQLGQGIKLDSMKPEAVAAHVRHCLGTPSGKVLGALLDRLCHMEPRNSPEPWENSDQIQFRYGRMTLHQALQHACDPKNFNPVNEEISE